MTNDVLGMRGAMARIPASLARTNEGARELHGAFATPPTEVLVLGRSVAAHASEFVNAAFGRVLAAPLGFVASSVALPDRVGPQTAVVSVALSAADAVVVEASTLAAARGASVVLLAADKAAAVDMAPARFTRLSLPAVPRERLALYAVVAEILSVLEEVQVVRGTAVALEAAAARARARIEGPFADRSFGEELARRLGRTFPLLVGAPGVGLAAARWWQVAMAANARVFSHAASTVEYQDALLAGFGQSGDVTRQVATLVLLRTSSDPPEAATAFAAVEEWLVEAVADVFTVEAEGSAPLAQLVDLAVLGDLTSVALAAREGIDPGPAPVIDRQE